MAYEDPDLELFYSLEDNVDDRDKGDDNEGGNQTQTQTQTQSQQSQQQTIDTQDQTDDKSKEESKEFDLIAEALKARGINDPSSIKIQTDTGIITQSFDDLSNEDKLQILNSAITAEEDMILDQEEANIVNFMRENELTSQQVIDYYKRLGAEEYAKSQQSYDIDNYTDDQILALDLKSRFDDWTDDEILNEVERIKQNESVYQKRVNKIREEFKQLEEQEKEAQAQEAEKQSAQQQENQERFIAEFKNTSKDFQTYSGIDLDQSDLNSVYDYVFKPTINGASKFAMDFNNPKKFFKMAFLMTQADDMFNNLHTAYQLELNKKDKEIEELKSKLDPNYKSKNNPSNNKSKVVKQETISDNPDLDLLLSLKN